MSAEIKPLTPETTADFFDFFDNRAFTDHQEWSFCYCTYMHTGEKETREIDEKIEAGGNNDEAARRVFRETAAGFIENGELRGYLAYEDGVAVGWVNANDKAVFKKFDHSAAVTDFIRRNNIDGRTKSVVCFTTAPECRGKGIAAALLDRVVADARAEGYAAVEGYAFRRDTREPFDYTGPLGLFEKAGFAVASEENGKAVMRLMI
ncbi:MAG: GNAT family N-acetyltransferase [Oscillospiraceae bacterium]|jgi:GNAT superfamily N-acetyltransferase|nr:GNAT family N-acetyltransferase [Oscillospiraceae bacterium]